MVRQTRHLRPNGTPTRGGAIAAAIALTTVCGGAASPEPQPALDLPSTRPSHPALEQLNRECVALYEGLQGGVLRVQVPSPLSNRVADNVKDAPWARYKITREVRQELERRAAEQSSRGGADGPGPMQPPTSQPGTGDRPPTGTIGDGVGNDVPSARQQQQQIPQVQNGVTIVVPPQQGLASGTGNAPAATQPEAGKYAVTDAARTYWALGVGTNGRPSPQPAPAAFAPNTIGLLLGDRRHVLVPTFVDRDAVGDQPVRLAWSGGDADVAEARLVGADHQTQLSVLRLTAAPAAQPRPAETNANATAGANADEPAVAGVPRARGRPIPFASHKPADGALVLVVSPPDGTGRLAVWNNGGVREAGVVVTIGGEVAGVARAGQFLPGGACVLIADQIVRHGSVRRATLGVIISRVEPADPARRQSLDLGDRPAVRVDEVVKGSAAERGGLRQGDLILSLAGEPVHDIPSLASAIAARSGRTELAVLRDGRVTAVAVELVQR